MNLQGMNMWEMSGRRARLRRMRKWEVSMRGVSMQSRAVSMLTAVALVLLMAGAITPAWAGDCLPAPGVDVQSEHFITEVRAAHQNGQGSFPVTDALFGMSGISAKDQQALALRDPVTVTRQHDADGIFGNHGPKRITVSGIFASRPTFFQIPKLVSGRYSLTADGITLTYDPGHAVTVGETFLGVHFSKIVNHVTVTQTRLSYFFGDNTGDAPDRCYDLTAK